MSRSVVIKKFGGPEVLCIAELDDSRLRPGPDEVRLRIRAIGLNRTEITLRSGRSPRLPTLPSHIGFEAAGEIEALGEGVQGFAVGDRVALVPTYAPSQYGFYAESSLAPAKSLVRLSPDTNFSDAAATWVAFGTAWSGLVATAAVDRAQSVAINAASSSVGLAAIQIAKRAGAKALAITRTSKKAQALLQHGADAVIVSQDQSVDAELKRLTDGTGVDVVLDAVGGAGLPHLLKGTREGGLVLLYGALESQPAMVSPFDIFGRGITLRGFALPKIAQDAEKFAALVSYIHGGLSAGVLTPTIARTFRFDDIVSAHRYLESGEQFGKVVVIT